MLNAAVTTASTAMSRHAQAVMPAADAAMVSPGRVAAISAAFSDGRLEEGEGMPPTETHQKRGEINHIKATFS